MSRLISLLKKLFSQLLGKGEQYYEENKDPVALMRSAITKIEKERTTIIERFIKLSEQNKRAEAVIEDYTTKLKDLRYKAKKAKADDDMRAATTYARQIIRIQDWLDKYNKNGDRVLKQKQALKEVNDELSLKLEELQLDISLIETSKDMAEYQIHNIKEVKGFGSDSIDAIIKEAHDRVAAIENSAEAHEEAYETFVEPKEEQEAKRQTEDEDVRKVLDEL